MVALQWGTEHENIGQQTMFRVGRCGTRDEIETQTRWVRSVFPFFRPFPPPDSLRAAPSQPPSCPLSSPIVKVLIETQSSASFSFQETINE